MRNILKLLLVLICGCGRAGPPVAKDTILPDVPIIKRAIYRNGELRIVVRVEEGRTYAVKYENMCSGEIKEMRIKENNVALTVPSEEGCTINIYALNKYKKGRMVSISIPRVEVPPAKEVKAVVISDKVELRFEDTSIKNIYRIPDSEEFPLNSAPIQTPFFIDHTAEGGKRYRYIVRNVVLVDGIEFEGEPFITPIIKVVDRTPPPPPLQVIVIKEKEGIKIEWTPSIVEDLAGYFVYIRDKSGAHRLTEEVLRDTFYYLNVKTEWVGVSSVDTSGNESRIKWERIK